MSTAARWSALVAILLLLGLLLAIGCQPHKGWRELPEEELRALFAGSTVEGYQELYDYRFRSYYDADGWFRSEQGDEKSLKEGKWWTNRKGDMCIRWNGESRDLCRKIITDDFGQYKKVRGRAVVVTFTRFAK